MARYTFTVTVEADDLNNAERVLEASASWADDYSTHGDILSYTFESDEA